MTSSTPQAVTIYELYPRKCHKPVALRAILKAISRDGFEKVRDATKLYAERAALAHVEMRYIPHPATFYNAETYNDDLDAVLPLPRLNGHAKIIPFPLWQQAKAVENLLEENAKALHRAQLPNPLQYDDPRGARFEKDRNTILSKRTALKEECSRLKQQLIEIHRKVVSG